MGADQELHNTNPVFDVVVSGASATAAAWEPAQGDPAVYEWLIVGAGITGIFGVASFPHEQRKGVLVIDQQDRVGGLWAWIPRWQTIQNDPIEFCTEGFTTRKQTWTADDVCHMLEMKVKLQGLAPHIRLGHRLEGYEWDDKAQHWAARVVRVADGASVQLLAKRIILATGKHARPTLPYIPTDGSVQILHSSQVAEWSEVRGKKVAVLGGGASALDLCMHATGAGVRGNVEWVARTPQNFSGISFFSLVPMIVGQLLLCGWLAAVVLNVIISATLYVTHFFWGTLGWLPGHPVDVRRHQLIPGRAALRRNKRLVTQHKGTEISKIENGALHLKNGDVVKDVDVLLCATGFAPPERPAGFERPNNFANFLPTGKFAGKLYLMGEDVLDTTGSSPAGAYMMAVVWRAFSADPEVLRKLSEARWSKEPGRLLNMMDPLIAAAPLDRRMFPWYVWRLKVLATFLYYRVAYKTVVFFPGTVIKTGLNLDDMERATTDPVTVVTE